MSIFLQNNEIIEYQYLKEVTSSLETVGFLFEYSQHYPTLSINNVISNFATRQTIQNWIDIAEERSIASDTDGNIDSSTQAYIVYTICSLRLNFIKHKASLENVEMDQFARPPFTKDDLEAKNVVSVLWTICCSYQESDEYL